MSSVPIVSTQTPEALRSRWGRIADDAQKLWRDLRGMEQGDAMAIACAGAVGDALALLGVALEEWSEVGDESSPDRLAAIEACVGHDEEQAHPMRWSFAAQDAAQVEQSRSLDEFFRVTFSGVVPTQCLVEREIEKGPDCGERGFSETWHVRQVARIYRGRA